jgi:hypothetical protein
LWYLNSKILFKSILFIFWKFSQQSLLEISILCH